MENIKSFKLPSISSCFKYLPARPKIPQLPTIPTIRLPPIPSLPSIPAIPVPEKVSQTFNKLK